jgi:hypothetical protein
MLTYCQVVDGVRQPDEVFELDIVRKVEEKESELRVTVETLYPEALVKRSRIMRVSQSGVRRSTPGNSELLEWRLRLPTKDNETWETRSVINQIEHKKQYKAHGPEPVKVAAGTFQAIRIEVTCTENGKITDTERYWYVPGLGEVMWEHGCYTRMLKSFTPAKQ